MTHRVCSSTKVLSCEQKKPARKLIKTLFSSSAPNYSLLNSEQFCFHDDFHFHSSAPQIEGWVGMMNKFARKVYFILRLFKQIFTSFVHKTVSTLPSSHVFSGRIFFCDLFAIIFHSPRLPPLLMLSDFDSNLFRYTSIVQFTWRFKSIPLKFLQFFPSTAKLIENLFLLFSDFYPKPRHRKKWFRSSREFNNDWKSGGGKSFPFLK